MVRVAQCWDDGLVTDRRLVEILRRYQAKATFNLDPSLHDKTKCRQVGILKDRFKVYKLPWCEVPEVYDGFEVASHTMSHCNAHEVDARVFLEEALGARRVLEELFQRECLGFAWPYGRYTPETVRMLSDAGFAYGRTTENAEPVLPVENPMILRSSVHHQKPEFWESFERAKAANGVFYFWGHSFEFMDDENLWGEFEEKIRRLSADPEVRWVNVIDLVRN